MVKNDTIEMDILNIIVYATDCKNHAFEALRRASEGDYDGAKEQIKLSEKAMERARSFNNTSI